MLGILEDAPDGGVAQMGQEGGQAPEHGLGGFIRAKRVPEDAPACERGRGSQMGGGGGLALARHAGEHEIVLGL